MLYSWSVDSLSIAIEDYLQRTSLLDHISILKRRALYLEILQVFYMQGYRETSPYSEIDGDPGRSYLQEIHQGYLTVVGKTESHLTHLEGCLDTLLSSEGDYRQKMLNLTHLLRHTTHLQSSKISDPGVVPLRLAAYIDPVSWCMVDQDPVISRKWGGVLDDLYLHSQLVCYSVRQTYTKLTTRLKHKMDVRSDSLDPQLHPRIIQTLSMMFFNVILSELDYLYVPPDVDTLYPDKVPPAVKRHLRALISLIEDRDD